MNGDNRENKIKKASPAAIALALLASSLACAVALVFGYYIIGTVLLTLSAGLMALLVSVRAPAVCFVVCPLSVAAAAVLSQLSGGDFTVVIIFLSFIWAGGILALCVSKDSTRTGTTVFIAAVLALFILTALIVIYLSEGNAFTPQAIREYVTAKVTAYKESFAAVINENFIEPLKSTEYYKSAVESGAIDDDVISAYGAALAETSVLLSPGIIIMLLQAAAYLCTCWYTLSARLSHCEVVLPSPKWALYPTTVTVTVYFIAYMVYTVTYFLSMFSETGSTVGVVALNLILVTIPSMFAIGCRALFRRRSTRFARGGGAVTLVIILLIIFSPLLAVSLISFIGAFGVLAKRRAEAEAERKSRGDDNDRPL